MSMFGGGAQQVDTTIHNPGKVIHNVTAGHHEVQPDQISWGSKLGEGAMAQIFRARIKLPNGEVQECVAKKLKHGTEPNSQAYKDLVMELDILTSVQKHPNLVEFYGACIKDTQSPIILEEYVDGPNLEDFLMKRNGKRLPKPTIYKWTMDLMRALDFIHNRNPIIIHRDLKPANLILTRDLELLKLADFGMSKKVDSAARLSTTHKGHTGTLRYMAPEVANQRTGMYTEKVDIYSASLIVWYMACCVKPELNRQDPTARPELRHVGWESLQGMIQLMWSHEPEKRPSANVCIQQMTSFPDKPNPHDPVAPAQGCACSVM
eukprot:CAMPEP_0202825218 /NCGR_PEP_ID=MMETSP1389-20130828/12886_1 /ASSEMBLY_ACC=CAM_ASM_000865 /TAXON_ID=302021 /ORGANISM="Rhodomonas sp., Strain CCMP768" /LENGTH=319 /DNA_ID=CAMNT_0049498411 /DNA_START=29 /DNA_END=988 /DNA_ORIENTATION=-